MTNKGTSPPLSRGVIKNKGGIYHNEFIILLFNYQLILSKFNIFTGNSFLDTLPVLTIHNCYI